MRLTILVFVTFFSFLLNSSSAATDTLRMQAYADTSLTHSPDSAQAKNSLLASSIDTAQLDTTHRMALPSLDSAQSLPWEKPFWHLGVGWSLGSLPFFDIWANGLADSLGDWNIHGIVPSRRGIDSISTISGFDSTEKPTTYSIAFPLLFGYTPFSDSLGRISFDGVFLYASKQSVLSVKVTEISVIDTAHRDTVHSQLDATQTARYWSLWMGASRTWNIPKEYLSVTGVDATSFEIGIEAAPVFIQCHKKITYKDSLITLMASYSKNIDPLLPQVNAWGIGAGFHAAISSLRTLGPAEGIEMGLRYRFLWSGFFNEKAQRITTGTLSMRDPSNNEPLSITAHRFELFVNLLKPTGSARKLQESYHGNSP